MIKWYKPSEKMPNIGDNIGIIFDSDFSYMNIIEVTSIDSLYITCKHSHGYSCFTIEDITIWAYASDFNFPKDVE